MGLVLLLASWAAAWAAASALLRRAGVAERSLVCTLALALVAVVPGQLCRLTADLRVAMALSLLVFGAALAVARARRPLEHPPHAPLPRPAWPAFVVGGSALVCVAHGAWFRNFFDEEHHVPLALALAHGVAPPEHPLLPGQVLPYHWGVDALYAQLVVAGLPVDRAIDLITVASFALLLWVASTLGALSAGRVGATLAPVMVPLAGSALAQPLHDDLGPFAVTSPWPAAWREWTQRPPPVTADFFQHPQGLAMPLVLAVLALFTVERASDDEERRRRRVALGAVLLACLSLVQAVHFLVLGFGLAAATLVATARGPQRRRHGIDLALLAGAAVCAPLLGGFFAPGAGTGATLVWGTDFFRATSMLESMVRHLVFFGAPLLFLPVTLGARGRLPAALVLGAAVGFLLPNLVVYRHSWDIVKLYSAGAFLAAIACVGTLARWWSAHGLAARIVVVTITIATIEFPLAWLASRTVLQGRLGVPVKADWRPGPELMALGAQVRPLVDARERVLVYGVDVARLTGLAAPGFDARRFASGHIVDFARGRALQDAHGRALALLDEGALDELGVRWLLFSDAERSRIGEEARRALDDPQRFERVREGLPGRFSLWRRRERRSRRRRRRWRRARRRAPARRA
ncbi:MAG: hypothetical protein IT383_25940 [Deltaproteobacteria bacterium]|nr:hypothetical protein [Deltaproteobacteria bacterium]